jgi:hypothetical protein
MAVVARPLSHYFKHSATAVINFIADEFVTRIETDDGWYVEPPPTGSLMEAVRQIRLWAGSEYEVAVIEDLDNSEMTPVSRNKRERFGRENPRISVQQAAKTAAAGIDQREDAVRRIRRCA